MTTQGAANNRGFDAARLDGFLRQSLPELRGEIAIEFIPGGLSNPTFYVNYENRALVLRKQPAFGLPSAHAVDREYRIMTALYGSNVPVPRTVLFYAGRDVVETPFYVMERLDGRIFSECSLPGVPPAERGAIYLAMADMMGRLHKIDWKAAGLSDYGKPGNYFQRQIARWSKQWQLSKTREDANIERIIGWLSANLPATDETTICHGDFRLPNLMFHPTLPQIIGVLDWELSTLGHPLADVAYNCLPWHLLPSEYGGLRGVDLAALGIPSEKDYLAEYYRAAGRRDQVTTFHYVLAFFRLAVIFEGIADRAKLGTAVAQNSSTVGNFARDFASRAVEMIEDT